MGQQQCCQNVNDKSTQLAYKFQNLHNVEPIESLQGKLAQSTASSQNTETNGPSSKDGQFIQKMPQLNSQVAEKIQEQCTIQIPGIVKLEHGQQDHRYFRFKKTGVIYRGQWLNGKPNGWGQNFYPNGAYYEGSFVDGIPHGFGRLIMSNGQYYVGAIKFGRANGTGEFRTKTGHYKGQFIDNLRHGFGHQQTPDSQFIGAYEYGQKRRGMLKFNNNEDIYEGEFQDNMFHGKGKLATKQGVYNGEFKNGHKSGMGQFKWKDGSYYRGSYAQGQRDGYGQFFNSKNKTRSRGLWRNGILQGQGQYIEKGKIYKCIWTNGKLTALRK